MINRRNFLFQTGLVLAAPAIVRASSLMAITPIDPDPFPELKFKIERIAIRAPSRSIKAEYTIIPADRMIVFHPGGTYEIEL